ASAAACASSSRATRRDLPPAASCSRPAARPRSATPLSFPGVPQPRHPMSVLRFDNVSKQYPGGQAALSEVSFDVGEGEMLFITGHSGAGKSTLLRLVHLAERPSRGAVLFGERNLARVRGRKVALHRRDVGVVFQDHRLLTDRSVFENVSLPLILR